MEFARQSTRAGIKYARGWRGYTDARPRLGGRARILIRQALGIVVDFSL